MSERSVFISKSVYPFFEEIHVNMDWFGGFALSQKRKCQISLHLNFLASYPEYKVLEVSSASILSLGSQLSSMNLSKRTLRGCSCVESVFQSSRIYSDGIRSAGPFPELLFLPGKECKKIVKERSEGMHSYQYHFDGTTFFAPPHHISQFYDYIYLNALLEQENRDVSNRLLQGGYSAFSDLATKSLNCQARSSAIFIGLVQAGLIDKVKGIESYLQLFRTQPDGTPVDATSFENVQLLRGGEVGLLRPPAPCSVRKYAVEKYYAEHCYMLTNRKDPKNFIDTLG